MTPDTAQDWDRLAYPAEAHVTSRSTSAAAKETAKLMYCTLVDNYDTVLVYFNKSDQEISLDIFDSRANDIATVSIFAEDDDATS